MDAQGLPLSHAPSCTSAFQQSLAVNAWMPESEGAAAMSKGQPLHGEVDQLDDLTCP